jgi:serine/threonine protein kinase
MAGSIPSEQVAHIGADVAEALHYMHERGIVHRDIKPANILLAHSDLPDRQFHAKLADFGIARLTGASQLTATGLIIGTATYLSPEQARGGEVGTAADIYSLGLVLLEALTGQKAFPGNTIETISARLNSQPAIPNALGQGWGELLTGMTALDPALRPLPLDIAITTRALADRSGDAGAAGAFADTVAMPAAEYSRDMPPEPPAPPAPPEPEPERTLVYPTATTGSTKVLPDVATSNIHPAASGRRIRRLRGRVIVIACAVLVVAAAGGIALATGTPPPAPSSSSPLYPAVPGTLGTHLKQLQESVIP